MEAEQNTSGCGFHWAHIIYLTLGRKAIKLHGGLIQADAGKKTPAQPQAISQAMFVDLSWFTGKAPLDGQSDKKSWNPPFFIGKPQDGMMSTVRGWCRILNLPPKFAARSKLFVRPDALPCPKTWGMVTARPGFHPLRTSPRRLKMTTSNGGAKSKFRQRIISLH
jgi:hypothetical protein